MSTKSTDTGDNKATTEKESVKEKITDTDSFNKTTTKSKLYENEVELQKKIIERELYRKYSGSDIWVCPNCNDSGDRFHVVNHACRMNKKK